MKFLIISTLCLSACLAQRRPQEQSYDEEQQQQIQKQQIYTGQQLRNRETIAAIPIIRFEKEQGANGKYKTAWKRYLKAVDPIGDEQDFHVQGDHLPTPPPVSAEIQKGLDLIYAGIKAQNDAIRETHLEAQLEAQNGGTISKTTVNRSVR